MLFAPQLFSGRVFLSGDWPHYLPFSEFSGARWRELHQRTFWNPYVFAGVPAAASLADSRPQYLPDLMLDALGTLDRLPVWPPLVVPLLAHLAGMLAAALLVRSLWGTGTWAMAWAGVAWGLMPNLLVPFAHGHHAQLVTVSLMPVALLATHRLFAAEGFRAAARRALVLALVIAIQTIAGHPQFVYYSALLTGAFALERAWLSGHRARLALALAAALMGFTMSAATWWPMSLYGADSVRGVEGGVWLGEVRLYSIALRDFLVFVWPRAMGFGGETYWGAMNGTDFPQYFGILVVLLLGFAWSRPEARGHGAGLLLAGAALLAVVLSLGTHLGPAYALLHFFVPLWSRMRVAVAVLIVAQLACALLSARGLDRALAWPSVPGPASRARRGAFVAAAVASVLAAAVVAIAPGSLERAYARFALHARDGFGAAQAMQAASAARMSLMVQLALAGAAAILLAWRGSTRPGARLVGPALVLLLATDLGMVSIPTLRSATGARDRLAPPPVSRLARLTAAEPHIRASSQWQREFLLNNDWVSWRVPWLGGSHGTPPRRWNELMGTGLVGHAAVQRALAVRYVSNIAGSEMDSSDYERVPDPGSSVSLWRLRGALSRAYAVPQVLAPGNDVAVLSAMARDDWLPGRVAFTTDVAAAGLYPGSPRCAIGWVEDSPDRLILDANAPDRAFIVVADAFFAGWRARVDGEAAPLFRVNHMVRGVAVPAGRHRLTMSYEPPGWAPAVATTRGAALLWLVLLAGTMLPGIRKRTEQAAGA